MSYDNSGDPDEFKIRRQKLREASLKSLTPDDIKNCIKEKFKGKNLQVVADDKTYSLSIDFVAIATDLDNNKSKRQKDATLAIEASVHMPIEGVVQNASWLLARAAYCRAGL